MARNTLVINCDICETRVCLIEDGVIAELQIERASQRSSVGNIVLGKVTRVLPGMQAAFIDVGMDRAAFLHVEDLIRPNDFEAYLDGGAREDAEGVKRGRGGRRGALHPGDAEDEDENGDEDEDGDEDENGDDESSLLDDAEGGNGDDDYGDDEGGLLEDAEGENGDDDNGDDEGSLLEDIESENGDDEDAELDDGEEAELDDGAGCDEQGPAAPLAATDSYPSESTQQAEDSRFEAASCTVEEAEDEPADRCLGAAERAAKDAQPGRASGETDTAGPDAEYDPVGADATTRVRRAIRPTRLHPATDPSGETSRSTSIADAADEDTDFKRRRRRRRRRKVAEKPEAPSARTKKGGRADRLGRSGRRDARRLRGRNGHRKMDTARVSRSVPITEVVKEGDEVIVQISKEPIGTKGARVTSHVSLPGRHVVYLPTVEHIGISKRIGSARERARLREVFEALKPEKGGLIVRTVAEGLTKKALKTDVGYLIKLWAEVSRKRENAKAPAELYTELDLVLKTARDLFTDEIEKIVIDDRDQYARLVRFVEMFLPERVKDVELYQGAEPIFDAYGIEDEIGRALSRKVPLPSGGYLVIDQAEALTAIDVNTGRYVGKGSKDLEETALKTNLEAVDEIAYQLRFRNIGGLVILDLIDMEHASSRDRVWRALEQRLAKDKAKTTLNRISDLGLIEMTRKRTRESLSRTMHEPCFYCDGTGQIMSRHTIAYEILRQIRREREALPGYSVVVNAHPAIVDLMRTEEKEAVAEAERRYMRRIELNPRREYHIEQFDLQGK